MPDAVPTRKGGIQKVLKPKGMKKIKKKTSMHTLTKKGKFAREERPGQKGPRVKKRLVKRFGKSMGKHSFPFRGRPKPGVSNPKTQADRELSKMHSKGDY